MDKLLEHPIRVIDIPETLNSEGGGIHFVRPHDWGFHVLSHTWSGLVRQMSERIGLSIGASVGEDEDAYSLAFRNEDLRQEPCYSYIMDIFQLLHADGVRYIWFDALCINQTQEAEKSHEINNMGGFFSLTKGSYVVSHGFGKANGLWGESIGCLPRWFTRVWTFQEFLLPQQVSFLVEGGIDHRFVALINKLIKDKGKSGLCKCFLDMPSAELDEFFFHHFKDDDLDWIGGFEFRNPQWKSIVQLIDERSPHDDCAWENDDQPWTVGPTCYRYLDKCCKDDNKSNKLSRRDLLQERKSLHAKEPLLEITSDKESNGIICGETTCSACGSRPMIRQANITQQKQMSYFFDREVYLALMQCHSRLLESCGPKPDKPSRDIQVLRGLYCALATEGNWRPCHVICEVGGRDCSNEEDRVLALLGLLGLRLKKLRTGKPLPEQILELAKVGGSAMLLELCTVNQKGSALPHMSWAPDFHGHNEKLEHASRPKEVDMQVEKLLANGSLQVKAKVVHGRVVSKDTSVGRAQRALDYCLIFENHHPANDQNRTFSIPLRLTFGGKSVTSRTIASEDKENPSSHILHFEFSDEDMKEAGSFEVPIEHLMGKPTVSFPVCLLLLGKDVVERKLLLICLPNQKSSAHLSGHILELHKIGSMGLNEDVYVSLHNALDSNNMQDCIIGGFGKDLTQYITHTYLTKIKGKY
ncbi:hypothetical protein GOP47_0006399 [Adiantum capillus-veneris]|uniref:Heterokaryon incompatibility domain-containing protein n=1 Tax=Adiantum capillus-veneris TaxID=13818 RepID=A0A9D4ZK95_ADICA|nr:hypothetical protein GOP47_0006399 [Adiantum capillus-veneris]